MRCYIAFRDVIAKIDIISYIFTSLCMGFRSYNDTYHPCLPALDVGFKLLFCLSSKFRARFGQCFGTACLLGLVKQLGTELFYLKELQDFVKWFRQAREVTAQTPKTFQTLSRTAKLLDNVTLVVLCLTVKDVRQYLTMSETRKMFKMYKNTYWLLLWRN